MIIYLQGDCSMIKFAVCNYEILINLIHLRLFIWFLGLQICVVASSGEQDMDTKIHADTLKSWL
jgi:hypothetical protein